MKDAKVFLYEDLPDDVEFVTRALKREGHTLRQQVSTVPEALAAIALLDANQIDVFVLDSNGGLGDLVSQKLLETMPDKPRISFSDSSTVANTTHNVPTKDARTLARLITTI